MKKAGCDLSCRPSSKNHRKYAGRLLYANGTVRIDYIWRGVGTGPAAHDYILVYPTVPYRLSEK